MRAVVCSGCGAPDRLAIREVSQPRPAEGEVLIRVQAATVNRTDCGLLRGKPRLARLVTGLARPRQPVMGTEFAGYIEATGAGVTKVSVGDAVFGFHAGTQAEFMTMSASVGHNPGWDVSCRGCADDRGRPLRPERPRHGHRYTAEDFTQTDARYDVVFDAVGKNRFGRCRPLLKPGGQYLTTDLGPRAENLLLIVWTRWRGDHRVRLPLPTDVRAHVQLVRDLLAGGHLRPVVDRTYALDDIVDAYRYVESERKLGNVVVTVP